MKTVSEELFHLIHSLGKAEKRSFKLFSSIDQREKKYVQLFDLIADQKKYDEEAIVKKLGIRKGLYAVHKNYLYNLILQKMAILHSGKETQIRRLLTQSDFLHSKGLYSHSEKILSKAKKLAHLHDSDTHLLEILSQEHRNSWRKRDLQKAKSAVEEEKKLLHLFNNKRQYTHLSNEIITRLTTLGDVRNITEAAKTKALINHPLIKNEKNALTFRSKYSLYHTLSLYYSVNNNHTKHYQFAKKAVGLYLSNPEKIKLDTFTYLLSVHLMLTACHSSKKYDEAKFYIDKLREESAFLKNEREKIWAFFTYNDNNLHYYVKTGQFAEGIPDAEKLIKELEESSLKLEPTHVTVLFLHIVKIYFGAENYTKCLFWLNTILNEKHALDARPGIESGIRMLYLIVHFEKKNYSLLHSLAKSTQHYFSSKGILYEFEKTFLGFFSKKFYAASSEESIKAFRKLKLEIEKIAEDKTNEIYFDEFDYIAWIDSKIEKRPFAEIVKIKIHK